MYLYNKICSNHLRGKIYVFKNKFQRFILLRKCDIMINKDITKYNEHD